MANPILETQAHDTTTLARLGGSLTAMNAPELRVGLLEMIKQNQPKVLGVNLAGVDFIDSSSLGVFVEAKRALSDCSGSLTFTNVNSDIRGLMRIMKLDAVFDFVDDEGELIG